MTIKLRPPTDKEDRSISDYWKTIAKSEGQKRMELVQNEAATCSQLPKFKNKDFYVCLFMNRHPRAKIKQSFYRVHARLSCPTPHYCMALWKYHHLSGELEFMWMVPAKQKAYYLARNYPNIPEHELSLAYYSICAINGTLFEISQAENGYKKDAIIYTNTPA